jgi:hypothetical protein
MTRWIVILGIWLAALSLGIVGFQLLTYIFYHYWQPVTVEFVWGELFGPWPAEGSGWTGEIEAWFGRLPLLAVGIALSYLCFLAADSLPQSALSRRQARAG